MLLVATAVNFVDVAGAELLAQVARGMQEANGALYVAGLKPEVREVLERAGVLDAIGRERLYESTNGALRAIQDGSGGR